MIWTLVDLRFIPATMRNLICLSVFDDKGHKYLGGDSVWGLEKVLEVWLKLFKDFYIQGITITAYSKPIICKFSPPVEPCNIQFGWNLTIQLWKIIFKFNSLEKL